MAEGEVRDAYAVRAAEYTALFGSTDSAHEQDRKLVAHWARSVRGPAIDAGCGPGQWTSFLRGQGVDAEGIDLVPSFIEQARTRFPWTPFRLASLKALGVAEGHLGAILSWYSVIHLVPVELPAVLTEFARCIRPGGGLLLGFFEGPDGEPFPHVVTTAYTRSADGMGGHLAEAGFEVKEAHNRSDVGRRPHAAVSARRVIPKNLAGNVR